MHRPDWNKLSPFPVPLWFVKSLRRISPSLVLQYTPPDTVHPLGVPAEMFPRGCLDVCRRVRGTRLLHPVAVWSLIDTDGKHSPPGPDTVALIRTTWRMYRAGQLPKLERELSESLQRMRSAQATKSKDRMREAMRDVQRVQGDRQWTNRVYLKRGVKAEAA